MELLYILQNGKISTWDTVPNFGTLPVNDYQSGAKQIEDLTAASWHDMLTDWKARIDDAT